MTGASRILQLADQGSHYYRADFQVHTPRDSAWSGPKSVSPDERTQYARDFVSACREKGLHAVAITDHHDLTFAPLIRAAAAAECDEFGNPLPAATRLIVFPGLELTLALSRQALLLLDADFPDGQLSQVLHALAIVPHDPTEGTLPSVQPLDHIQSFADLHRRLDEQPWLKGRYIVLPNVTDKGHKTMLRKGMAAEYKELPCVGGYLDGPVEKIGIGNSLILAGKNAEWGNKRLALFQTSDSRSATFADLGRCSTWVKWVHPTAEAIRQACLAQESRITHGTPSLPSVWISRVSVSTSKFLGRVDVSINPQYTALIGGRGTGKSTVLDYLRWALCDQPAQATEDDEVADPRVRQRKLIEATLEPYDATVEVDCIINGIAHVVRRHARDGSVLLKVGDSPFEKAREAAIQSLLPIQAYSQKQLSSVAIRVEELLRFVTAPILPQLDEIDREVQQIAVRLRENYATLLRHRQLAADIERSDLRAHSLAEQGQSLRNGLAGISEEDRAILDSKSAYGNLAAAASVWAEQLAETQADLSALEASLGRRIDSLRVSIDIPSAVATEADAALAATSEALLATRSAIGTLATDLRTRIEVGGAIQQTNEGLQIRLNSYEKAYGEVKDRSSAHESMLVQLSRLEEEERRVRQLLQSQTRERDALGDPNRQHQMLRSELSAKRQARSDALVAECAALTESSDGMIQARLSTGRGLDGARSKFKALIGGSNVRGTKIDAFFEQLQEESDPRATWDSVLGELESLMLREPDTEIRSELTPTLSRLGLGLADQRRLAPKLTPDGWLDLSLTPLADHPEFLYRSKENEYIPFGSASAGQQASALLATLLSQGGMPLIIDQPEDDLDSDTVQQIVARIWQAKNQRQLIFASHNANLVVNGDADLVLACSYVKSGDQSAGHISKQGAIDVQEIRDEITRVMEGGERAFKLRKEKYGF